MVFGRSGRGSFLGVEASVGGELECCLCTYGRKEGSRLVGEWMSSVVVNYWLDGSSLCLSVCLFFSVSLLHLVFAPLSSADLNWWGY